MNNQAYFLREKTRLLLTSVIALLTRSRPPHFLQTSIGGSVVILPPPAGYWIPKLYQRNPAQNAFLDNLQTIVKRLLDIGVAGLGLVLTLPLMGVLALVVKASSKGAILFQQERIGQGGHPFMMYKFRSMYLGAEQHGPSLAAENDPRITRSGRSIRKWRLDELPQLWNVLKGDMTLVGPRPERQFFIDRITDHAPNYTRLLQLKPGLTSMGIIRFGYASTVPEMIDRQRHDQYYFENRSLGLDIAILFSTLYVIASRKGK